MLARHTQNIESCLSSIIAFRSRNVYKLVDQAKQEGDIDLSLSTPVLVRLMRRLFLPGYEDMVTSGRATTSELIHTPLTVVIRGAQRHE